MKKEWGEFLKKYDPSDKKAWAVPPQIKEILEPIYKLEKKISDFRWKQFLSELGREVKG